MSERIVPISSVNNESDRVSFHSNTDLPSWVDGTLVVNLDRLLKIMNYGGIKSLVVKSGDTQANNIGAQIVGFTRNGEAIMGKATMSEKDRFQHKNSGRPGDSKNERQIDLTVFLPPSTTLKTEGNLHEGNTWANIYDKTLRESLKKSGIYNLLSNYNNWDKFIMIGNTAMFTVLLTNSLVQPERAIANLSNFGFSIFLFQHGSGIALSILKGTSYRLSLIPRLELEHSALVLTSTAKPGLIKNLSEK